MLDCAHGAAPTFKSSFYDYSNPSGDESCASRPIVLSTVSWLLQRESSCCFWSESSLALVDGDVNIDFGGRQGLENRGHVRTKAAVIMYTTDGNDSGMVDDDGDRPKRLFAVSYHTTWLGEQTVCMAGTHGRVPGGASAVSSFTIARNR